MDSSVPPTNVENGIDPFEQPADVVRRGLDGLRALYDQQCSEIQRLQQEAAQVQDDLGKLQAELAEAKQQIIQLEAAATNTQAEDTPVPTGRAARRQNVELRNRVKELEAEIAALQRDPAEPAEPAEIESPREEREQLKQTTEENGARLATLQTELKAATQKLEARGQELEAKRKEISGLSRSLNKLKKALDRTREDLDAERATNLELRQDLDAERAMIQELHRDLDTAAQAKQAIQHDLEICKSSRDQLARQVEDLQVAVRKEREQAGWEVATRLTAVLTKLSALANMEPDHVVGLSERAVFEDFRAELGRAAGGRLEPFPGKHELADNLLWLDADQNGMEALQARYDWSPERPFEGLQPGSRQLPFRLSRRGWSVGDRVLQRAHIVPVPVEQEPLLDLQPEEQPADPEQPSDELAAGQAPDELDAGQTSDELDTDQPQD